ncbi:hypothetical protein SBA1_690004 [Candidatus Sulfotelmatobacter kueseliae]|uniref:BIG2 domain-containing protein n=1 Tax=Candidatus Sulfotelmatobacter kueseliae TaxID=2042962 RepID=A0A2U3L4V0_9BACT|nr:hypothetical protein SBA1_690004 [Candidatus Sulfotelmatobacter kueseliae]
MNLLDRSAATPKCLVDVGRLARRLAFLLIAVSSCYSAVAQTITVSVSPGVASVGTGGSLGVSATVQNDSTNAGVTWVLTGDGTSESSHGCSGSTCGTLTNVGTFSVTYVAPSTVPSPATVTLTAYSKASNTSSSSVNIVVTSGSLNVWISPTGATVSTNQGQQFDAIVSGNSNTAVTWEVNGVTGGNSTVGTISTSGLYTAPATVPSSGVVTVTAVSQANSAVSASDTVAVILPYASIATTPPWIPLPLHGATVADFSFSGAVQDIRVTSYLDEVVTSLNNLTDRPTVRITFTLCAVGDDGSCSSPSAASAYTSAIQTLKSQTRPPFLLGEVLDSSYQGCFTVSTAQARWNDYVSTLGSYVDVWEIGNEINGNWLDSKDAGGTSKISCPWTTPSTTDANVVTDMINAYNTVKAAGKLAEMTLYYPGAGSGCDSPAAFDPITWTEANVPLNLRNGMDYVLLSYYHQDCTSGTDPSATTWGTFFTQVQNLFPNAKIGFGEWGYSSKKVTGSKLATLLSEGYSMDPYPLPFSANWVSGVFFWEWADLAVPYNSSSGSVWEEVNTDMQSQP